MDSFRRAIGNVVTDSEERRPDQSSIAVLQGLHYKKYEQIKEFWSSQPQDHGFTQRGLHVSTAPLLSDDILINIVREKIYAYIFSVFPLRVLKLPEMKLTERNAVAEFVVQHKMNYLTQEIYQRLSEPKSGTLKPSLEADLHETVTVLVKELTEFAVLSHTWGQDEPNYQDFLMKHTTTSSQGYKKLKEFCKIAHKQHGVEFAWADTVCINKLSSSELDESIRSMFTWYRESRICIIYLVDTDTLLDFPFDRWFTRGWTLQELLAPLKVKFYNRAWQPLTDLRNDLPRRDKHTYPLQLTLLLDGISVATGISVDHIRWCQPGLRQPSFPERMKWIARRSTTRPEDMSYSMMGILGISISVAYGEGAERAFFRLFQAALEVGWSPSWFLWGAGKPISANIHPSRMIPSSPACYLSWDPEYDQKHSDLGPISLTNAGLPIKVLVVPTQVAFTCQGGSLSDVIVTCPLSDTAITAKMITYASDYVAPCFALGILDYPLITTFGPEHVHAILLQKVSTLFQEGAQPWIHGEWVRRKAEVISLRLKDKFRNMGVDGWTKVEISGQEVDWEVGSEPKIELRTLYL